jgi:hypothetical protein
VSDTAVALLAIMALALSVMAVVQIIVVVIALRANQQMIGAMQDLRREVGILTEKINRIADGAEKVTTLAAIQLERVDAFLSTAFRRGEEVMSVMQGLVTGPVRQGAAVLAAIKAVMSVIRHWQSRTPEEREHEEDALFVG